MKKIFALIFMLTVLMISPVFADKVILLDFTIAKDDKVTMNWLSVVEGKPDYAANGNYAAIVLDREGNAISTTPFSISFYTSGFEELSERNIIMKIPYRNDAYAIKMQKGDKIISQNLIGTVCNNNLKCEASENYASCPTDCISGSRDNYCDGVVDGRCDPDCAVSGDKDCESAESGVVGTGGITETSTWLILIVIVIIIAFAVFYFTKGKKKK